MAPAGIYVHIPFCLRKCAYCDFYSMPAPEAVMERYTEAVCAQISSFAPGEEVAADTLYFGGGTPVLLGADRLARIRQAVYKRFAMCADSEVTLEANPAATLYDMLAQLAEAGFNRISFGVQSAVQRELDALGRPHGIQAAQSAVQDARRAGFHNISADMMLGIPHQTAGSLQETISFLLSLGVQHLSTYMLGIEPGTPFAERRDSLPLPDEDAVGDYYLEMVRRFEEAGYAQYEISNFARPGYESRHNCKYWRLDDTIGFGVAAHSFYRGKRFYTGRDLAQYLSDVENDCCPFIADGEGGGAEEALALGLRLREGVRLDAFAARFGADGEALLQKARAYERAGLMRLQNGAASMTPAGFLVSNSIITSFLLLL